MRNIVLLLVLLFTSASAQSITRAEVAKMSPHDLAVRVLGAVGETGEAKEVKLGHGAPRPWVEQIEVDFPRYGDGWLCVTSQLIVNLAPRDPDKNWNIPDPSDDPPVFVTNVDSYFHRFAASTSRDCKAIPDSDYFSAVDYRQARQAADAFKLYRNAVAANSHVLKCTDFTGAVCSDSVFAEITKFCSVISIQNDRNNLTIVLKIAPTTQYRDARELWLSLTNEMALSRAEVRDAEPSPVY